MYRWDSGVLSTVADTTTPVPGGTGTFRTSDQFLHTRLNQGAVSFWGADSANKTGLYRRLGDNVSVLLDTNSDGPAGEGKFRGFDDFGINGDDLLFSGGTQLGNAQGGVYSRINGQVSRLLNYGDPAPGGGKFFRALALSIENGVAVFYDNGTSGVYTNFGGELKLLVGSGTIIDGKEVQQAFFVPGGRDGNRIAVAVDFVGHHPEVQVYDEAVYMVTLPGPASLLPLGAAGFWAVQRRR